MMKKIERLHSEIEALNKRYEENKENEEICKEIRTRYAELMEEGKAEGEYFSWVFRMYESQQERGNTYIDVDELNDERKVAGLVDMFRRCGIQFFTFSSGWSSSNETAWELTKNGCQVCGMMEINSKHKGFMDDKFEKAHGYLFKVF